MMDNTIQVMPRGKAQHVAQQLLERIIASGLDTGSSIGTETELLAQYDVSRPTLRESLRILQSQGVLELRPGPRGGILVKKPTIDNLAHVLSIFLRLNGVPFIAVLKARETIEPALAAEAAANGTKKDFDEMERSIERMKAHDDYGLFIEENRIFHSIIAHASGNKVLEAFWSTISVLAAGDHAGVRLSFGNRLHVIKAHTKILEACRARNGSLAATRMREHVAELEQLVRKRYQNLLKPADGVPTRRTRRGRSG